MYVSTPHWHDGHIVTMTDYTLTQIVFAFSSLQFFTNANIQAYYGEYEDMFFNLRNLWLYASIIGFDLQFLQSSIC